MLFASFPYAIKVTSLINGAESQNHHSKPSLTPFINDVCLGQATPNPLDHFFSTYANIKNAFVLLEEMLQIVTVICNCKQRNREQK